MWDYTGHLHAVLDPGFLRLETCNVSGSTDQHQMYPSSYECKAANVPMNNVYHEAKFRVALEGNRILDR